MEETTVIVEKRDRVLLVTLNRPQSLNAINAKLTKDLIDAVKSGDSDPAIGAIVLTGSEKAFAVGADVKELKDRTFADMFAEDRFGSWNEFTNVRKPIIAAVSGYALGGGCELAMMCDFILAADNAKFGQPEINLGVIPGMGGSQRLTRLVGKSKAMDMCLTGRLMDAAEGLQSGLVSRVIPATELLAETIKVADIIASKSLPSVLMTKEVINRCDELSLAEGLRFERRLFHSLFASPDQKEGMAAFVEKREPKFSHS